MRVRKSRADRGKALTLGAKHPTRRRFAAFERLEDRALAEEEIQKLYELEG